MQSIFFKIIFIINCASFIWAGIFFFKKPVQKNYRFLMLNLIGIMTIFTDIYLLFITSEEFGVFNCLGGYLSILSFFLFWLSIRACKHVPMKFAFHDDSTLEGFVRLGPYRFVRHPFYTSYSISWLSAALMSNYFVAYLLLLTMIFFYTIAALQEEKFFAMSVYSDSYKLYMKSTGRFLPKISSVFKYFASKSK